MIPDANNLFQKFQYKMFGDGTLFPIFKFMNIATCSEYANAMKSVKDRTHHVKRLRSWEDVISMWLSLL